MEGIPAGLPQAAPRFIFGFMTASPIALKWVAGPIVLAMLAIFVLLDRQGLAPRGEIAGPEPRPDLLRDARWSHPASAGQFIRRFGRGAAEGELVKWLAAERFSIDRKRREASRHVSGVPCGERISVTWSLDRENRIQRANAEISEAGCL